MLINESVNIKGALTILVKTPEDKIIDQVYAKNQITKAGRDLVARLFDTKTNLNDIERVSMIGVGGGDKAFDPEDTGLESPVHFTKIISIDHKVIMEGTIPRKQLVITGELKEMEAIGELTEAGLFTGDKNNKDIMYNRVVFKPINKSDNFKLTLIWEIIF